MAQFANATPVWDCYGSGIRPAAIAPIQPLAQELPYAMVESLKRQKKKRKRKEEEEKRKHYLEF